MTTHSALTLVLLLSLSVAETNAQTRIPDDLSCVRCTIRMERVATLGASDGPAALRGLSLVNLDGAGRYWVLHQPDLPLVFDSAGRLVSTPFRKGQGPNEFQSSAMPIPLPGDSTLATEFGRGAVLGPDLRAVRTIALQQLLGNAIVLRWPDRVLVNGYTPARARRFEPLHLVSFAGNSPRNIRSFGGHPGEELPASSEIRASLVRSGNQFWVAHHNRYRLTLWDTAATIVRVLERKPSWFPQPTTNFGGPDHEPGPLVSAMSLDERGLLWVFINVAAPTWREAWPKIPAGVTEIRADAIQQEKLYRTIVEVIDPRTARVVARSALNDYITAAFSGRRAAIYYTDADGTPHFAIVRFTLDGR